MATLGKYRILGELGQGGMADVYLATPEGATEREQLVVIKRLRNLESDHVAMFLDEARIAGRLSHRNIVRTHDIGQENGWHFIVMEYLHGPTLYNLRRNALPHLPWPIEIYVACSVLDGLHHAHELRAADGSPLHVVHRDLSPENVIVTEEGEAKILDFGIAKAIDSISQTQAGAFKGKLRSMPPEQLRGEGVDRRADVYAAGVMLAEGLTGQSLWGDLGNVEITARLARCEVPSVRAFVSGLPPDLREICTRATDIRPENRYPTALEFREALLACAQRNDLLVARPELAGYVTRKFAAGRERIEQILRSKPPDGEGAVAPEVVSLSPVEEHAVRPPVATRPASSLRGGPERSEAAGELSSGAGIPVARRRRLPGLLMGLGMAVPLAVFFLARPLSGPPRVMEAAAPVAAPPVPVPAEPRPHWEALPEEKPVAHTEPAAVADEPAPPPPPRAASHRQRPRPQHHVAAGPPPPAPPVVPVPAGEQPRRWNGRALDLDNPYPGGAPAPAASRPKRTIDNSNPFPTGGPR